jgi:hypothetical protein
MILTPPTHYVGTSTTMASTIPTSVAVPSLHTVKVSRDPFIPPIVTSTPYLATSFAVPRNYQDLNTDGELRQRMTSYYFGKLYDQWIYSDFGFMLKNLKVNRDRIVITRTPDKNASEAQIQAKVDFLKNKVMTRNQIYRLLVLYTNRSKTNWYDLKLNKQHIKNLLRHKLAKAIRQLL